MREHTIQTIGDIGDSGWFWGASLEDLENQLRGVQADVINVPISSYGGDYFDGIAIYHYLKARKERVTTSILGFAMSMGSIIALAGDRVILPKGGYYMIHNANITVRGDDVDLQKYADYTRSFSMTMASIYFEYNQLRGETKLTIDEIKAMMDAETFLTAEKAKEYGFVTEITNDMPVWTGKYEAALSDNAPEDLIKLKNSQNMKNFDLKAIAKKLTGRLFETDEDAQKGLLAFVNDDTALVARLDGIENIVSEQLDDATKAVTEFKANYVPKTEFDALKTELEGLKTAKTDLDAKMTEIAGKLAGKGAEQGSTVRGGAAPNFTNLADKRKEFSNVVRFQTKAEAEAEAKA